MKKAVLIFLLFVFTKSIFGQTVVDDLIINPNPFQKRTAINYSFINTDTVTINVYNVTGSLVVSPVTNSVMLSGNYRDSLIMDAYTDGMYFVQLKLSSRKTIVKKAFKSNTAGITSNSINLKGIKVYPNLFQDKITVESLWFNIKQDQIKIFNSLGQCVYYCKDVTEIFEINLSFLDGGIYYFEIQDISGCETLKIIKE